MQELALHHMQLLGSDKGLLLALSGLVKGMRAAEMNASSAMLRAVCEWGVRLVLGPLAAVQPEAVEAVGLAVWQLAGDDTARQVMSANLSSGGIKLQARTGEGASLICCCAVYMHKMLRSSPAVLLLVLVMLAAMLGGMPCLPGSGAGSAPACCACRCICSHRNCAICQRLLMHNLPVVTQNTCFWHRRSHR